MSKNLMNKLLCKIGAHSWEVSHSILKEVTSRKCMCCGKVQKQEVVYAPCGKQHTYWREVKNKAEASIMEDQAIIEQEFELLSGMLLDGAMVADIEGTVSGDVIHIKHTQTSRKLTVHMKERLYACEDLAAKWRVDEDGHAYVGDCLFIENYRKNYRFHRHIYSF